MAKKIGIIHLVVDLEETPVKMEEMCALVDVYESGIKQKESYACNYVNDFNPEEKKLWDDCITMIKSKQPKISV